MDIFNLTPVLTWRRLQSNYIEANTAEVMYSKRFLPSPQVEYIAKERIDIAKT